jgi:capsular polysaccharide biosynthesis protein
MEKSVEVITFIALLMGGLCLMYTFFMLVLDKNIKKYERIKRNEN